MPTQRLNYSNRNYKSKYDPESILLLFAEYLNGETKNSGEEHVMYCPVHEDPGSSQSASASLNPTKGRWYCFSQDHGGSIDSLVRQMVDEEGWNTRSRIMKARAANPDLAYRKPAARGPQELPDPELIAKWTESLLQTSSRLEALMTRRGLTRNTIIDYEIGFDTAKSRYTIPVFDLDGAVVNVRKYKMDADPADKMRSITGHGSPALFLQDVIRDNDTVVLTEGELDAILLNQIGIPAATHTGGAAKWQAEWREHFEGKTVYVAYDADKAGAEGSLKVFSSLKGTAAAVYKVDLPADPEVHGYDITDYIVRDGYTADDFRALMIAAAERQIEAAFPDTAGALPTGGVQMTLSDSMNVTDHDETIEIVTTIAGKMDEPFTAPKRIQVRCDMGHKDLCVRCPVFAAGGDLLHEVRPDDASIMMFVDAPRDKAKKAMRETVGARCSDRSSYEADGVWHVHNLLVQPSIDDQNGNVSTPVRRTLLSVTDDSSTMRTNEKVRFVGKNTTDAKTGQLRFLSWHKQPLEMDIDTFELTTDYREALEVFQVGAGQSPLDKCLEIARDLSDNVTHIYDRDLLHVGYDLVYHSPLSFRVAGQDVAKGWLEMMVVGDTRTGKSKIAEELQKHYQSGRLVSCEGMSFAGIVGGLQQFGQSRFETTWGVVPMNDRRLVILDEVSGLAEKGVIEKMSSVRSSGVAQIIKIRTDETQARTRLIWITNPANGRMIEDQSDKGIGALSSVVPNAEDQARFDFVMATAKGDVASEVINQGFEQATNPEYTSAACEALIKWIWSLKPGAIRFSDAAVEASVEAAIALGARYLPEPPLIQAENARYKILRIAVALAARTFNCAPDAPVLLVGPEHVRDAVRFLDLCYEEPAMHYAALSDKHWADVRKSEESYVLAVDYFRQFAAVADAFESMDDEFHPNDLRTMAGLEGQQMLAILRTLMQWKLLVKRGRLYRTTPLMLKAIQESKTEYAGQ